MRAILLHTKPPTNIPNRHPARELMFRIHGVIMVWDCLWSQAEEDLE